MPLDTSQTPTREAGNPRHAPPPPHSVTASISHAVGIDGTRHWGIVVDAVLPTFYDAAHYEVYGRFQGAVTGDWVCLGKCHAFPMYVHHPILTAIDETVQVSVVLVSSLGASLGPEGGTKATVTITSAGVLPPDVTGFAATPAGGGILFDWNPLTGRPDVLGYEIRAGSTGWLSATLVTAVAPVNCPMAWVPRSQAAGTSFYCKAKTRSEDYSSGVATATITAAEGDCLDAESLVGYQEVTVLAGATSVTVTTVCPYAAAPYVVANASGDSPLEIGFGTWSQNGDNTWSATLYVSAVAPTATWLVILHEAGA